MIKVECPLDVGTIFKQQQKKKHRPPKVIVLTTSFSQEDEYVSMKHIVQTFVIYNKKKNNKKIENDAVNIFKKKILLKTVFLTHKKTQQGNEKFPFELTHRKN